MEKENKKDYQKLYRAILSLKNEEECQAFFEDLYTISELDAAAQRLKASGLDEAAAAKLYDELLGMSPDIFKGG